MKRAVCLLSGGLDSSTVVAMAKSRGYDVFALTVNYGQKHKRELDAAKRIAKFFHISEHKIIDVPLATFGGSSLTDKKIPVPQKRDGAHIGSNIPSTYVPARNIIFVSLAFAYAEAINASAVFIGANAIDYSGYPDCRPDFFNAFRKTLSLGTKAGKNIKLLTPLVDRKKSEIIKIGCRLGVPYRLTWSCYSGEKKPCGKCDSCILRAKGFRETGIPDPLIPEKA